MYKRLVRLSLRLLHQAEAALAAPAQERQPRTYGTPQGEGTAASDERDGEGGGAVDTPAGRDNWHVHDCIWKGYLWMKGEAEISCVVGR